MTLATADADGRPSARVVLLKGFDDRRIRLLHQLREPEGTRARGTSRRRAAFLLAGARAADSHRGRRCDGRRRTSPTAYFTSRPRGARLGAWASPQSEPIGGRAALQARSRPRSRNTASAGDDIPRPPHWGGYRLAPDAARVLARPSLEAARPDLLLPRSATPHGWIIERLRRERRRGVPRASAKGIEQRDRRWPTQARTGRGGRAVSGGEGNARTASRAPSRRQRDASKRERVRRPTVVPSFPLPVMEAEPRRTLHLPRPSREAAPAAGRRERARRRPLSAGRRALRHRESLRRRAEAG